MKPHKWRKVTSVHFVEECAAICDDCGLISIHKENSEPNDWVSDNRKDCGIEIIKRVIEL